MLKLNRTAAGCSLLALALYAPPAGAQCAQWSNSLGNFTPGYPRDVILFDAGDGQGPTLWIAWSVSVSPTLGDGGVRRRVGNLWYETESNMDERGDAALAVYDDGAGAHLYAGGDGGVRKFVNGTWEQLGPIDDIVHELAVVDLGAGPELYVGCFYADTPNHPVLKRVGNDWVAVGAGTLTGRVNGLVAFDSGAGPELYVCGGLTVSGSQHPSRSSVRAVGRSCRCQPLIRRRSTLEDIAVHDDGSGPRLAVAYRTYGGRPSTCISTTAARGRRSRVRSARFADSPAAFALESHDEYGSGQKSLFVGGASVRRPGRSSTWRASRGRPGRRSARASSIRTIGSPHAEEPPDAAGLAADAGGRREVRVAGGLEAIRLATWEACPAGVVSCAGDGSGTPCPCGNDGAPGAGCPNSLVTAGRCAPRGRRRSRRTRSSCSASTCPTRARSTSRARRRGERRRGRGVRRRPALRGRHRSTRLGTKMNAGGASQYPAPAIRRSRVSGRDPAPGGARTTRSGTATRRASARRARST